MSRPAGGRSGTGSTASEYLEGGEVVLAALESAAASRRTGTAWLMGGNVGALYFRDGRVVGAELEGSPWPAALLTASGRLSEDGWREFDEAWSGPASAVRPRTPAVPGMSILEWTALSLDATVEAASELLPLAVGNVPAGTAADMVFQPDGVPPWTASTRPAEFAELRREVARRHAVLARLEQFLTPDTALVRASPEWLSPVQVSAQQWRILAAATGNASARAIGRRIGSPTFATTIAVAVLMRLGMIAARNSTRSAGEVDQAFPRVLFMDAVG